MTLSSKSLSPTTVIVIESIPADNLTSVGMGMTVMGVNGCPQGVFCMEQFE
jgi:hypothetical protein